MGTYITTAVEVLNDGHWTNFDEPIFTNNYFCEDTPISSSNQPKSKGVLNHQCYEYFTFLANVRECSPSIPRLNSNKGLPTDCTDLTKRKLGYSDNPEEIFNDFGFGWVSANVLCEFDYEDSGKTYELRGTGDYHTLKELLGTIFFTHLKELEQVSPNLEDVRLLFSFN